MAKTPSKDAYLFPGEQVQVSLLREIVREIDPELLQKAGVSKLVLAVLGKTIDNEDLLLHVHLRVDGEDLLQLRHNLSGEIFDHALIGLLLFLRKVAYLWNSLQVSFIDFINHLNDVVSSL